MNGFGDYIPDLTSDRSSSDEENTFDDFMEEREKLTKKTMEKIEKLKKEGNDYVSSTKYTLAIEKYEKALEANEAIKHNRERHHDYYVKLKNNISHCYMKRKMYVPALDAAVDGLELDPKKHVGRSYQRAAFAFIKLDKIEIAYYTLKKAMFLCDEGDKDEVSKDLQNLLNDNSDLYRIKDKNWSAVRIKNFADEVKADIPPESEVPKRPKKTNEDKQKAKEAKAKDQRRLTRISKKQKKQRQKRKRKGSGMRKMRGSGKSWRSV